MASKCKNGRHHINEEARRFLWATSGGHCANPDCQTGLFVTIDDRRPSFGELAHIISATKGGPRDTTLLSLRQRAHPDNILLLCANCHTIVDKAPEKYTVDVLDEWKRTRINSLEELFGSVAVATRALARQLVEPPLTQNRTIFETYGPNANKQANRHELERKRAWDRKVVETVIPNNRRILSIAQRNAELLTPEERRTVGLLAEHLDDLEARHFRHRLEPYGTQFPSEIETLFE